MKGEKSLVSSALKANNGEGYNVEASAMPSSSDTGRIVDISPYKDYYYEPGETSDSDADVLSEPEENEDKEEDDKINTNTNAELSKGRHKNGRNRKYKDRHIRKRK
ncbi:hypothetical protein ILUMI_14327 [Ignelater luminosus]|uniref:Uncharacterized protein n=1 Tax=Ignelater luminosus TaxID=2038154 RepID=A0A8K0CUF9_IGNLU|nr:hypothetical protein ILUMI_14327 [Ignelater luminosus]